MSGESLHAKQEKWRLESDETNRTHQSSHAVEEITLENGQHEGANPEWRRFYEVIKEITRDMRY